MSADLTDELMLLLGDDGFFTLTEAYGGTRLYVPGDIGRSGLPETIGAENAARLSNSFPGGYIRIPLARWFRAGRYRQSGMSNRDIARKLGLTESSIDDMFRKLKRLEPGRHLPQKDPRQIDLFD